MYFNIKVNSYNSILLDMAETEEMKDKLDPAEIANEVFKKNMQQIN